MHPESSRVYTRYERIWHWSQAGSVLLLLATGLEIRGSVAILGFETATRLHEALGFFLLANAFLGLFYFLASGAIRQYVGGRHDLMTLGLRQVAYYLRGVFRGDPHPGERSPARRLNPLQKLTYVMILNVLLPWQILTGLSIWGLERWPRLESLAGDLTILVPLHAAGAWLFAAFLVAHVYLTTMAGPRLSSGLRTMVTGVEDAPAPPAPARSRLEEARS